MNEFSVFKTEDDKRLVFGWASIAITVDGEPLEDRQKDVIDPEDLEEAAYEYVLNFRDAGEEHIPSLRKKGKLVESCVLTEEKQKAMGIPEGTVPVGWWIGFKIEDEDTWQRVKNGTYKMFSIEGKASREPIEKAEQRTDPANAKIARTFSEILKFNPFHDSKGRFASSHGLTAKVAGVPLSSSETSAIQPRDGGGRPASTKKVANDHDQDLIVGKDISKTVDVTKIAGGKDAIDKIAELQGWNKAPTVTNDLEMFQKAAKQSGRVLIRSVCGNDNTGESADDVCKVTMTDGNAALGGGGQRAYGSGMYMVGAKVDNASERV